ncbi:MAG: hypothetical protein ILO34_00880, partial [Kiritimatiellae bacterium]|nr:hypothetical protein [Kiritimatiellia bacterium]
FTQNGTFKLISFALGNGYHADAMALDRYLRGGGCAVAEYLLFGEELDEERRHAIDDHLMRKWFGHGLPVDGSLAIGNLAYGDGAANEIDVACDTSVASLAGSGVFVKKGAGALSIAAAGGIDGYDVRDGSLAIKGTVPAVFEEAFIWLDPSDESTLVTNSAGLVTQINDVRGADVNYACRSGSSSAIVEGATLTAFGPNDMPVLDMGGYNDSTSVGFVWNRQCSDARTIFVVAARNENHGEQFLLGHESQFCFHADSGHYLCGSATGSGYWSGQAVLGATWNIDGESVANGDSLYSTAWPVGQLQVFSISGCDYDGWPAIVGQLAQDRTFRVGGLKYGEVIVFQRALAETEVKRVRDYLLEKWLGMDVDPYGAQYESLAVASGAKIFHDGALSIPDGGMLSVVAPADPDGAVEVSGSLDLGEAVTLRIDVGALETPPSGEIVVASYSGDLRGADNLAGWTVEGTAVAGRKVSLSAGNGRLVATLSPVGTVIIVR